MDAMGHGRLAGMWRVPQVLLAALPALGLVPGLQAAEEGRLTVFAAASSAPAVRECAHGFTAETGVGADAVFGPLRDNESGMSTGLTDTDVQGHKLGAAWSFAPNFSLSLNAYLLERIEGGSGNVGGTDYDEGATYQIETL